MSINAWRAARLLASALFLIASTEVLASGYAVVELPVKSAAKGGDHDSPTAVAIAADGCTLVHCSTHFSDGTFFSASEVCKVNEPGCRLLPPKGQRTEIYAASTEFGWFAGSVWDEGDTVWAVRQHHGTVEYLFPGTGPSAINERGVAAGVLAGGKPFRFESAQQEMETLPGIQSWVSSINDAGVAVGMSSTAEGESRAVQWDRRGRIRILQSDVPPGHSSIALFISRDGSIYGNSTYHDHGTVLNAVRFAADGKAMSLGTLGGDPVADFSVVRQANNRGAAVGYSSNSKAWYNAVLFENGAVIELAAQVSEEARAKYSFDAATAINDDGKILVNATRRGTQEEVALRLDPLP